MTRHTCDVTALTHKKRLPIFCVRIAYTVLDHHGSRFTVHGSRYRYPDIDNDIDRLATLSEEAGPRPSAMLSSHSSSTQPSLELQDALVSGKPGGPLPLPPSSILLSLPPGRHYATHSEDMPIGDTWGWMTLVEQPGRPMLCGLRMCTYPADGSAPHGPYLVEYLGRAEREPLPAIAQVAVQRAVSLGTAMDSDDKQKAALSTVPLQWELLRLTRGRLSALRHPGPDPEHEMNFVDEFAFALVAGEGWELVLPLRAEDLLRGPPSTAEADAEMAGRLAPGSPPPVLAEVASRPALSPSLPASPDAAAVSSSPATPTQRPQPAPTPILLAPGVHSSCRRAWDCGRCRRWRTCRAHPNATSQRQSSACGGAFSHHATHRSAVGTNRRGTGSRREWTEDPSTRFTPAGEVTGGYRRLQAVTGGYRSPRFSPAESFSESSYVALSTHWYTLST